MSLPTSPAIANGNAPNVLIVEDDAATRRLYKFLLTNGGYPVLEAEDGVAAPSYLRAPWYTHSATVDWVRSLHQTAGRTR